MEPTRRDIRINVRWSMESLILDLNTRLFGQHNHLTKNP